MGAGRFAGKLLPPPGLPRTIAFQSGMNAVGSGAFLTAGVVFFVHGLGMTPVQVGIGFSVAGLTGLVGALPLGMVADRLGGRAAWAIGAVTGAASLAVLPFVHAFAGFVAVLVGSAAADTLAGAGRTIYTSDAIPAEGRVRAMAFVRTYLNIGLSVGTGLGALVLAANGTAALIALVYFAAALQLVNAVVVSRLPVAVRPGTAAGGPKMSRLAVLTDRGYLGYAVLAGVLLVHAYLMTEVLPLWIITRTDAPKPVLGLLFALNTALVILLQVPASRGSESMAGTQRLLRLGGLTAALACPVALVSGLTSGWLTVAVLVLVIVLLTATELWLSAAEWYVQTSVPPPAMRGAYIGLGQLVGSVSGTLAPVGLTLLAIQTGGWGWWVIAAIFLGCTIAAGPVVGLMGRTPRVDGVQHHEQAIPAVQAN
ncbi:MFS transporter [Krasilnikovia cinnamomea]|uniref:MFS transporter n=1 Tax=Krasilnikovia cinnamomea TaxID=349313 RepID=A0A4Q7ZRV1_9ACTN|nr:MFS transporter [Krasilnikovia cinnamomea]RZU53333.1 MFS transporter [Krasilnikovia cinnamomea]